MTVGPLTVSLYELCAHPGCGHFIEEQDDEGGTLASYVHLDDGEREHDHDGAPSGRVASLLVWKETHPELFREYGDGKIGPNSTMFPWRQTGTLSITPGVKHLGGQIINGLEREYRCKGIEDSGNVAGGVIITLSQRSTGHQFHVEVIREDEEPDGEGPSSTL